MPPLSEEPGMLVRTLALALLVAGCGEKNDPVNTEVCKGLTVANMSYAVDIKPILERSCTRCHSSSSSKRHGAPRDSNLDTYDAAVAIADEIEENVVSSLMPPNDAI